MEISDRQKKQKKSTYNQQKNQYTQKYIHENYKQLSIRLPLKGEITREVISDAANKAGQSVNGYIISAIAEKMERDRK